MLERDMTGLIDGSEIGVIGVLRDNDVTTPAPALVGLGTGGVDVLERDIVVNRLVDDGGPEVLGVFGGVVDEDVIPPPATLEVEEPPSPPATPGPPPMQTKLPLKFMQGTEVQHRFDPKQGYGKPWLLLHWPRVARGQEIPGRSHASALCASTVVRMRKRALSRTMGKGKEYDCACIMAGFRSIGRNSKGETRTK